MGLWNEQSTKSQDASKAQLWEPSPQGDTSTMTDGKDLLSPRPQRTVRRLSSATADFASLSIGPHVVVPPKQMCSPSDAHETAAALELAKHRLKNLDSSDGIVTPSTPPETTTTDSYAFAFDIDGVLIRGGRPIPEAIEAMKVLNGQNQYGIKVYVPNPWIT